MKYICYDRCFIRISDHNGQEVFIPMLLRGIPGMMMRTMNSFISVRKQSHKEWILANGDTGRLWFTKPELETFYLNSPIYETGYMNKKSVDLTSGEFSKWMLKGLKDRAFTCEEYLFMKNSLHAMFKTSETNKTSYGISNEADIFRHYNRTITLSNPEFLLAFGTSDVMYPDTKSADSDEKSYYVIKTSSSFFAKFSKNRMHGSSDFMYARNFNTEDKALAFVEENSFNFGQFGYEIRKVVMRSGQKPQLI